MQDKTIPTMSTIKIPILSNIIKAEHEFNIRPSLDWIERHWHFTIWLSCIYVLFLAVATTYMKNRKPFDLRVPLGIWSLLLAIFSLYGSIRMIPEWFDRTSKGFIPSICRGDFTDKTVEFWMIMFTWSKVFELVDTVFIVLRKQKLIFLHWYHHIVTMMFCFYLFSSGVHGPVRWFTTMNFAIHTVMYGYYSIKAFQLFRVPSIVSQVITTSQILQMIMGFVISVILMIMQVTHPGKCDYPLDSNILGLIIYTSFLVLFVNFFIQTYIKGGAKRTRDIKLDKNNHVNNHEYELKKKGK